MELPISLRESLVDDLDDFLEALSANPSAEAVAAYLVEQLEVWAEDEGEDDLIGDLEDEAALDGSLLEVLESEMDSNEEFEWTGEEVVSLFEQLCEIDWEEVDDDDDLDDDEEDEDF
ncbi:MAG: hypothetical protein EP330_30290 [Deltaproteobacteria bacterium]|nr:MAG: hypothetical protein EP330_30290 [Deltaproteobacteria bacterium]